MLPRDGSVAGIDVGYSTTRPSSAICRLTWTASSIDWHIKQYKAEDRCREKAFREIIDGRGLLAVAIDGPLRRGFDQIGEYRLAEQLLTRRLAGQIGKPGQSSSPVGKKLNAAANVCANLAKTMAIIEPASHAEQIHNLCIVEAFPSSFMGVLFPHPPPKVRRGKRSDVFFGLLSEDGTLDGFVRRLLRHRELKNNICKVTNHDQRAALICAFTALCVASAQYSAVGDPRNGWIILPPGGFIANWARNAIRENVQETEGRGFFTPPSHSTTS